MSTLYCSFCGKSQHEVAKLISGPTAFICDECVELCRDIVAEARADLAQRRAPYIAAMVAEYGPRTGSRS